MCFDETFLSYLGGTEINCLSDILDMHNNEVNEFQIIRRSSCYDYGKFNEFAKQNKDRFNILSTNIQPINSKLSELELFKFIMYADDITLFSNFASFGSNMETKEYLINAELSNVIEWLNMNKLSVNN